ncbi:MAG: GNAT family N-acetyltransferase, partial [Planctomycetota bacterium]
MGYAITQAKPSDDQEELNSLINRNFQKSGSQWFNWSQRQNPFGENLCWLARDESAGKLIGSTGLFPRRMNYNGQPFAVGQAEAINIDEAHRSAQVALKLQRTLISHLPETDFHFVYGMTETAAA